MESEKDIYAGYMKQYAKRLIADRRERERRRDEAVAAGTLPDGSLIGTEYDTMATTLIDGRRPANPEQFAKWRAGKKDVTMGSSLWWPEEKKLESAGILQNIGAGIGEATYAMTEPMRKNLGLETKGSEHRRAGQITANNEIEGRKKELKGRIARGEDLGDDEIEWLAENDKGFFASFAEGVESLPELAKTLASDPDERREFFNDMLAQLPASIAASKGIGTALNAARNIGMAKRLAKAAGKAGAAKDFATDQLGDAFAESLIEAGTGAELSPGSMGRNLGEGFGFDGALQTGLRLGVKGAKKISEAGNGNAGGTGSMGADGKGGVGTESGAGAQEGSGQSESKPDRHNDGRGGEGVGEGANEGNSNLAIEEANARFNEELQKQIAGTLPEGHIYEFGKPGEILQSAGIPDFPIELNAERLAYKAEKNNRHPFNILEIKDLPNAINDPIAIFAYGDKSKAVNVITEIEQNRKNFLVGISLNPEVNGNKLNINSIRTVFPKDIPEWKNWIEQGKALYLNNEKLELLNNPRIPEDVNNNSTDNIQNSPASIDEQLELFPEDKNVARETIGEGNASEAEKGGYSILPEQLAAIEEANTRFNEELENFTPENADSIVLSLGNPSEILRSVGIEDKPLKLYGNKLLSKMKKHGFAASDLKDLPNAINNPIAVFEGNRPSSFSVLTEINIGGNNVLAIIETGKGTDIDFNLITSAYGKAKEGIANWVNDGKMLYLNKEKAPDYLRIPVPITGAQNNQEPSNNIQNLRLSVQKNARNEQKEAENEQNLTKNDTKTLAIKEFEEVPAMSPALAEYYRRGSKPETGWLPYFDPPRKPAKTARETQMPDRASILTLYGRSMA